MFVKFFLQTTNCALNSVIDIAGQTSANSRLKTLQQTLHHLIQCAQPIKLLVTQMHENCQSKRMDDMEGYSVESDKLLGILKMRLEVTLLALVKTSAACKKK